MITMNTILLGVAVLTLSSVSLAQTPQAHSVLVLTEDGDAEPVASGVKAKIGGTLRYQVTEGTEADLWIDIKCHKITVGDRVVGVACSATYLYHPESLVGAEVWLATDLYVGPNEAVIAQGIFEAFVDDTSDSKLAKKKTHALKDIRFACHDHVDKKDEVALACGGLGQ
jgi:hypothetical protein